MSPADQILDYSAAVNYLRGLKSRGVSLGIERMRSFAHALGDPHEKVPCIHIAGTNGKGSVAAMVESILRAAGRKTGLYTSPHLVRVGERIQVNRTNLSEDAIVDYVRELRPIARDVVNRGQATSHPSYFEFMTAMAFLHFERQRCEIAIIEVGMGGRLDATNIVSPDVAVITSIGLDHTDILGDTIEAIAGEKAGIIKPGRPVVIGQLPTLAERVVRRVASERRATVESVRSEFGTDLENYPTTNLSGSYQRINAAAATLAVRLLAPRWHVSSAVVETGLHRVSWGGRWQEFLVSWRTVIVDSAHNAEGAAALDTNLAKLVAEQSTRPIVVVGVLGENRARPILEVVARHAAALHLVVPAQARACSFEQLAASIPDGYRGVVHRSAISDLFPSPTECVVGGQGDVVIVAGSIYLAGEVLSRLNPEWGPNESDLQDF